MTREIHPVTEMAKKFLLACFIALALGAAAGFAMPDESPATVSATY